MFRYRSPDLADCSVMRSIATWDNCAHCNSTEYYLAFFRDFSRTSLVATAENRLVGFVIGYRRPAELDKYVIAQQALLPDFDTVDGRTSLLTVAVRIQVRTGAQRVELAVSGRDQTTLAALERVTEEQAVRLENAGPPFPGTPTAGSWPDGSLYRLGPFVPEAN